MHKTTRFDEMTILGHVRSSLDEPVKGSDLAEIIKKSFPNSKFRLLVYPSGLVIHLQDEDVDMSDSEADSLTKAVLPIFRQMAKTEKLEPFSGTPDDTETKLRRAVDKARAAIETRRREPR
jgi:hypothetical protein